MPIGILLTSFFPSFCVPLFPLLFPPPLPLLPPLPSSPSSPSSPAPNSARNNTARSATGSTTTPGRCRTTRTQSTSLAQPFASSARRSLPTRSVISAGIRCVKRARASPTQRYREEEGGGGIEGETRRINIAVDLQQCVFVCTIGASSHPSRHLIISPSSLTPPTFPPSQPPTPSIPSTPSTPPAPRPADSQGRKSKHTWTDVLFMEKDELGPDDEFCSECEQRKAARVCDQVSRENLIIKCFQRWVRYYKHYIPFEFIANTSVLIHFNI